MASNILIAFRRRLTPYPPQTQCTLTLFNMTEENIIIAARLPHDGKLKDIELLRKEKVSWSATGKSQMHREKYKYIWNYSFFF